MTLGKLHMVDALDFMRSLPDRSVDLIVTDPPYRTISGGQNSPLGYGYRNSVLSANDGKIFKHNDIQPSEFFPEFYRILRDGTHCYVMTNTLNLRKMLNCADAAGFELHNLLVWRKNTGTANRWYMKFAEYTLFLRKGAAKPINEPGSKNIFDAPNPRNKRHPTEKPVELMEHYILNSTQPLDIVFDPFMGCGTMAIAAERTGRRWIGCEIDPLYFYPALARIAAL